MNPIKDIDLYAVGGQFVAYKLLRLSTTTAFSQKKKKKGEYYYCYYHCQSSL